MANLGNGIPAESAEFQAIVEAQKTRVEAGLAAQGGLAMDKATEMLQLLSQGPFPDVVRAQLTRAINAKCAPVSTGTRTQSIRNKLQHNVFLHNYLTQAEWTFLRSNAVPWGAICQGEAFEMATAPVLPAPPAQCRRSHLPGMGVTGRGIGITGQSRGGCFLGSAGGLHDPRTAEAEGSQRCS
eukprot:9498400-Pyramimonas_sp.AAC.2